MRPKTHLVAADTPRGLLFAGQSPFGLDGDQVNQHSVGVREEEVDSEMQCASKKYAIGVG
jgi:hypothetical protein